MNTIPNTAEHLTTPQKLAKLGAWVSLLLCFSIACLGTAATTICSITAIVLWFISFQYTHYPETIKKYPFTLIALLLFGYIGISLLWSDHLSEGLSIWKKYREFILLPVFLSYFAHDKYRQYGLIALYSGMLVTLLISYLVHYGLRSPPPRQHSISNHIFNGILISFFAYWSLCLALAYKKYLLLFIVLFMLASFSIFIIREGRTGYILLISLILLFGYQHWSWKWKRVFSSLLLLLPICFLLFYLNNNLDTILATYVKFEPLDLSAIATLDIRLEYYINTLRIIFEHWLLGVGVGDFPSTYLLTSNAHENFWGATNNAHNEFLMISSQTGIMGLILFMLIFVSLFKHALKLTGNHAQLAIATTHTIGISCLFNSSFLDTNDGILFMLLIALFFSQPNHSLANPIK